MKTMNTTMRKTVTGALPAMAITRMIRRMKLQPLQIKVINPQCFFINILNKGVLTPPMTVDFVFPPVSFTVPSFSLQVQGQQSPFLTFPAFPLTLDGIPMTLTIPPFLMQNVEWLTKNNLTMPQSLPPIKIPPLNSQTTSGAAPPVITIVLPNPAAASTTSPELSPSPITTPSPTSVPESSSSPTEATPTSSITPETASYTPSAPASVLTTTGVATPTQQVSEAVMTAAPIATHNSRSFKTEQAPLPSFPVHFRPSWAVPPTQPSAAMPAMQSQPAAEAMPALPAMPSMPAQTEMPEMKESPGMPHMTEMPAMAEMKEMPAMVEMAEMKAMPATEAQPAMEAMPAFTAAPAMDAMPAMPSSPSVTSSNAASMDPNPSEDTFTRTHHADHASHLPRSTLVMLSSQ